MLRKRISFGAFVGAALLFGSAVIAQERDRFGLFTNCGPVHVVVEELPRAAKRIGVKEKKLHTLAEAALLGARIPTAEALGRGHYLYLNVNVVGRAFNWRLSFNKQVVDLISGEKWTAVTWSTGALGTHGGDGDYVLSVVRGGFDEFVVEYLRANLAECAFENPFQGADPASP